MNSATRLDRGIHLLRHYSWWQMALRAKSILVRRLRGADKIKLVTAGDLGVRSDLDIGFFETALEFWRRRRHRSQAEPFSEDAIASLGCDLERGCFDLLGVRHQLGSPAGWKSYFEQHITTHLWRFQLHYQEYLLSMAANQLDAGAHSQMTNPPVANLDEIWSFVDEWISAYDPSRDADVDAWHPYCISRRIPVWLHLLVIAPPAEPLLGDVLDSISCQLEHLRTHLEYELGGNHLLENLTTLARAGACLEGELTERWLETAEKGLARQLPLQMLAHGEHFELSPMYHCQVLAQLLRTGYLAGATANENHAALARIKVLSLHHAKPMLNFLKEIVHPDGEIPLFGDSGFGESPSVNEIRWLAAQNRISVENSSNVAAASEPSSRNIGQMESDSSAVSMRCVGPYRIFGDQSSRLICDFGEVAANHLPAHGHCDLLGFEASLDGHRWFVDSGNFNYDDDSMRHYCRSSIAHNVTTIDGWSQCDVWSKFRMGRRGTILHRAEGSQGDWNYAIAGHNGYQMRGFPWLERLVAACGNLAWVCVDHAHRRADLDQGNLVGYLHLSPEMDIEDRSQEYGNSVFHLRMGESERRLKIVGSNLCRVVSGWYCPEFGERVVNQVIEYRQEQNQRMPMGWLLEPLEHHCEVDVAERSMRVALAGSHQAFHWQFKEPRR